jgi:hypothetical protein
MENNKNIIRQEEPKQGTMSEAIKQVINNQLKQEAVMENKTPMQELKKRLFDVNIIQNPLTLKEMNLYIEKEKELLIDFHCEGQNIEESCGVSDAKYYYNEKFNNDGK